MKIKVVIADGRKLFREGLCLLLEKHDDVRVVGEADDARSAAKLVQAMGAHVVVLNCLSTGAGGADVVRSLLEAHSKVRIIILALSPSVEWVREIMEAGAAGCLTRESASAELVSAIRTVREGRLYLSPGLVHQMVSGRLRPSSADASSKPLAPREREILRRIAEGQFTKQIAAELQIGPKTVETHRRRIMKKLNAFTVADLTKHAIRDGLTSLEPV